MDTQAEVTCPLCGDPLDIQRVPPWQGVYDRATCWTCKYSAAIERGATEIIGGEMIGEQPDAIEQTRKRK